MNASKTNILSVQNKDFILVTVKLHCGEQKNPNIISFICSFVAF